MSGLELVPNKLKEETSTQEKVLPRGHGLVYSVFKKSVCEGQIYTLKKLLPKGLDINYEYPDGSTLLHYACRHQQKEIIQILLENGADVDKSDKDGYTPLQVATFSQCNVDVFRLLFKYSAPYNVIDLNLIFPEFNDENVISLFKKIGELFTDVQNCNSEVIDKLRELNEDDSDVIVNARSKNGNLILEVALANQKEEIAYELMKKITDQNFLGTKLSCLENIKSGLSKMVGGLQCLGFDIEHHKYFSNISVDDNLNTLIKSLNIIEKRLLLCYSKELLKVCRDNDFVSVEKLIKRARLNLNNQVSFSGLPEYMKDGLIKAKAKLGAGFDYLKIKSILFYHASYEELAKFVINTNARNGLTPLHIAAKNGNLQILKLLLKHGANYQSTFLVRDQLIPRKEVKNCFGKSYWQDGYKIGKEPMDLSRSQDVSVFLKVVKSYFEIDPPIDLRLIEGLSNVDLEALMNAHDNRGRPFWFPLSTKTEDYRIDFFNLFKISEEIVEQDIIL